MSYKDKLYINTPLLESHPLSKHAGITVYLKLENVQPSATFKIRGISHLCQKALKEGAKHFVCSSGGNAGLAAAYSARKLGVPATIIVPESTPTFTVERLRGEGATVEVVGKVWDDSNQHTLKLAEQPGFVYIPPFDHPVIWEGHASLVQELAGTLQDKPGAIILSVGGGGLLCGVVAGLRKVGWTDVPVVAMETQGADSFNAAVTAGKLVTIPDITSVAKCLGAKTVAQEAFNLSKQHPIHSVVVTDEEAVEACAKFLDDERLLVEPACGAALAAVYSRVISRLQDQGRLPGGIASVVVVVCGGNNITLQQLDTWKTQLGLT
ncbi:PREDICTED: L-serine dehydratase/L-threonine deaminase-like [Branchiostoma belcheri]|uniref:L-serine deaminase n=1 Tax=Branchiostoma belcheri TaxID=7741 RepID=A0A6P4YVM8_BRABE|nr:PREDICTED: L-serine dehydratase/L-threonine deaminase-like [Branchiostoma belcheri]XP_019622792.1 PREDICTED: L-serine dehydratase/L-threonine deaminase-like [Branchiostoma belcheri]